ncbi:MAG: hypothetical protein M1814_001703 [Vezdaea aestivalis]|nr:MAG: hypothetical protein M1814_001703 [Vezdaea aestivalis]
MIVTGSHAIPHRKPVPSPSVSSAAPLKPLSKIVSDSHLQSLHSRTRTTSSTVLPDMPKPPIITSSSKQIASPHTYAPNRRTLSNATASTAGAALVPVRTNSSASTSLDRSGSTRSMTPNGYVALMRKQKATVWCDRAQPEDTHLSARKRANRERLAREGLGRVPNSGSGSLTVQRASGKIMHRKANPPTDYSPADLVGGVGGVPMRLSASEVGDDGNDDGDDGQNVGHHRTASGRSSMGSGKRHTGLNLRPMHPTAGQRLSQGSTPPSGNGSSPNDGSTTPADANHGKSDYFAHDTSTGISRESGSSGDRENSFGSMGKLHRPSQPTVSSNLARAPSGKTPDDLRRRGSIDERTTTITNVRLYIANPDLSD